MATKEWLFGVPVSQWPGRGILTRNIAPLKLNHITHVPTSPQSKLVEFFRRRVKQRVALQKVQRKRRGAQRTQATYGECSLKTRWTQMPWCRQHICPSTPLPWDVQLQKMPYPRPLRLHSLPLKLLVFNAILKKQKNIMKRTKEAQNSIFFKGPEQDLKKQNKTKQSETR